jgi:hypothetical protein
LSAVRLRESHATTVPRPGFSRPSINKARESTERVIDDLCELNSDSRKHKPRSDRGKVTCCFLLNVAKQTKHPVARSRRGMGKPDFCPQTAGCVLGQIATGGRHDVAAHLRPQTHRAGGQRDRDGRSCRIAVGTCEPSHRFMRSLSCLAVSEVITPARRQ